MQLNVDTSTSANDITFTTIGACSLAFVMDDRLS